MTARLLLPATCASATLAILVLAPLAFSDNPNLPKVPVGAVAVQLTGRVSGSGGIQGEYELLCYATFVEGLGGAVFNGDPSEKTAEITLRSDQFRFQAFPNGSLIHFGRLAPAGTSPAGVRIYYGANPNRDFSQPDTFSSGELVGVLESRGIQGSLTPSFSFNASGTLTVQEAPEISIGGLRVSLRALGDSFSASLHGVAPSALQFTAGGPMSIPVDGTVYSAAYARPSSR